MQLVQQIKPILFSLSFALFDAYGCILTNLDQQQFEKRTHTHTLVSGRRKTR